MDVLSVDSFYPRLSVDPKPATGPILGRIPKLLLLSAGWQKALYLDNDRISESVGCYSNGWSRRKKQLPSEVRELIIVNDPFNKKYRLCLLR